MNCFAHKFYLRFLGFLAFESIRSSQLLLYNQYHKNNKVENKPTDVIKHYIQEISTFCKK